MKFELTDEKALLVSGLGCAFFGVHALASPRSFHNLYMKPVLWDGAEEPLAGSGSGSRVQRRRR